ncbi:MAG: hypothetical protein U0838_05900 [Chloroflexota bacterium]
MLVSSGSASTTSTVAAADEAVLLEALADAGDALTDALVAHDLDAITAATRTAETLCAQLDIVAADPGAPRLARTEHAALTDRIGATARRNAVLLESAWLTDAAILRLLAAAATEQDEPAGPYQTPAAPQPAGWLDRSA